MEEINNLSNELTSIEDTLDHFGDATPVSEDSSIPEITTSLSSVYSLLDQADNKNVHIEKIVISSTVNIQELQARYKRILDSAIAKIETDYKQAFTEYKEKFTRATFGVRMKRLLELLYPKGWSIVLESPVRLLAYRHYQTAIPVNIGKLNDGREIILKYPVCYIYGITVNLTYTNITSGGTIQIHSERQHPNFDTNGYACAGTLDHTPIPQEPEELLALLLNIENTYKYFYPESCYSGEWKNIEVVKTKTKSNVWNL